MCLALGYNVNTLKRVRIMNITLANLPIGKWRNFTEAEIKTMDQLVADSSKTADHTNYLNADLQE
jgi:23S rRNA pseudouridine2604 synthase